MWLNGRTCGSRTILKIIKASWRQDVTPNRNALASHTYNIRSQEEITAMFIWECWKWDRIPFAQASTWQFVVNLNIIDHSFETFLLLLKNVLTPGLFDPAVPTYLKDGLDSSEWGPNPSKAQNGLHISQGWCLGHVPICKPTLPGSLLFNQGPKYHSGRGLNQWRESGLGFCWHVFRPETASRTVPSAKETQGITHYHAELLWMWAAFAKCRYLSLYLVGG